MTPPRRPRPQFDPDGTTPYTRARGFGTGRAPTARLVAILVAGATYLACSEAESPPAPASSPRRGGTLIVSTHQDIAGVNDLVSSHTSFSEAIIGQLFLDLFEEQPDFSERPPTLAPLLAESYEFSDDRLFLTVRLRPGVTWSDGRPVTAEDVHFTWRAQTSPEVAWAYAQSKESVRDVEVVDDSTVRFHFDRAYATQLQDANEGAILPAHVWDQLPFAEWPQGEEWFQSHLVVNGPFTLAGWRPQEEIVLERNERFFDPELPRLDRVVFRVIPDRANHVTQLLRGEVDFVPRVDMQDLERIEASEQASLYPYWHRQYTYLGWNTASPLFSDPEVRRALTLAIDRQTIIDTLRDGRARLATSPVLSSVWAHADLEPWPYDPEAAGAILADRGWSAGEDGILERDGERFSFSLGTIAGSRSWRDIATMAQEQLGRVGVEVVIQPMEFNTLIGKMEAHDYEASIGSFGIDTSLDQKAVFHSDSIDGGYNFGSYSNPRIDELIDEARRQLDPEDAGPMLEEIQHILHQEQPFTFLWEPQRISAMSVDLREARPNPVSTYQNLRQWWIVE